MALAEKTHADLALGLFGASAVMLALWFAALTALAAYMAAQPAPTKLILRSSRRAATVFCLALFLSAVTSAASLCAYWCPALLRPAVVLTAVLLVFVLLAGVVTVCWLIWR